MIQPSKKKDHRSAEKLLRKYLKDNGFGIDALREWKRWEYARLPFWSCFGVIYKQKNGKPRYFLGLFKDIPILPLRSKVNGYLVHDDQSITVVSMRSRN